MSKRGTPFAATVAVIVGYLAADLFLDGWTAAAAVLGLGIAEYLVLLIARKTNHPSLLIEALVLAATVLAGDRLEAAGYPGAGIAILEIILGAVLLVTSLSGRPWLANQMKRFAGFSPEAGLTGSISTVMGALFLLHGSVVAAGSVFLGGLPTIWAIGSFVLLYLLVMVFLRRRTQASQLSSTPLLVRTGEEEFQLRVSNAVLATLRLEGRGRVEVSGFTPIPDVPAHEVLGKLESALRTAGAFSLTLRDWEGDTLPLEMSGYTEGPRGWTRVIGRRPVR